MIKLFLSVLNMSLTGAFVIAAICLARLPLKKAPKIISYALWAVAGFRLVFPFSIESVFSLIPFKAQPIPPDFAMQSIPRIDSGIPFVNNAVGGVFSAAAPAASANPLRTWMAIGAYMWLAGVAAMLVYGIASFIVLKRKMRSAAHIEANIYEAGKIKLPFVLGVFSPRIYLPACLSEHERGYILLHEQTHIRRYDHIVKFAAYFALCLHWFNPFAWLAFLLMGADMEMSCDERVVKELGGDICDDYSMSLVRIAAGRRILNGSPLAFGEGGIKGRVKRVLNFKKPSRAIVALAIALAVALSVGFAVNRGGDAFPMSMDTVRNEPHFAGTVTEVYDKAIYVSVDEGEEIRRSGDLFSVSLNVTLKDSVTHFLVGDRVVVYYDGVVAETNPGQITTVYAIIRTSPDMRVNFNGFYALDELRTPYVGDNGAVGKIIDNLPRIDGEYTQRFFSIGDDYGTGHAPYTLTIYYEPDGAETGDIKNITVTSPISALLFALIDNLEEVNYEFRSTSGGGELDKTAYVSRITCNRNDITEYLETIGLGWEDFRNDWNGSADKVFTAAGI